MKLKFVICPVDVLSIEAAASRRHGLRPSPRLKRTRTLPAIRLEKEVRSVSRVKLK